MPQVVPKFGSIDHKGWWAQAGDGSMEYGLVCSFESVDPVRGGEGGADSRYKWLKKASSIARLG